MIDPSIKLKKGDVVSVTGVVKHDYGPSDWRVYVDFEGHFDCVGLHPDALTLVRQHIKVGDRVCIPDFGVGEVLAVHGAEAWVFSEHERQCVTAELAEITRAPLPEEPEGAAAGGGDDDVE